MVLEAGGTLLRLPSLCCWYMSVIVRSYTTDQQQSCQRHATAMQTISYKFAVLLCHDSILGDTKGKQAKWGTMRVPCSNSGIAGQGSGCCLSTVRYAYRYGFTDTFGLWTSHGEGVPPVGSLRKYETGW